jgi:hypothetical protein
MPWPSGAGAEAPHSLSSQAPADIREVFRERQLDRLFSQELLQDLPLSDPSHRHKSTLARV